MKNIISHLQKVYIFGAQSRAKTLKHYLEVLYPALDIIAFIVDDLEENDSEIGQIPVYQLSAAANIDLSAVILVATKGEYHAGIGERLRKLGITQIIPVTVQMDNFFRNEYVKQCFGQNQRKFVKLMDLGDGEEKVQITAAIYIAQSGADKKLQSKYKIHSYEKAIQAGAALLEKRTVLNILTDCDGENISWKNRQYCELTVLFWIWKHAKEEIVGLAHYRRHFILPDDWQSVMYGNNIDVILPVPTVVYPSIEENYKERHGCEEWLYLMEYLQKNSPNYYSLAKKVFAAKLYSPCNMFIMRREILNELCKWLFPILDAVAVHVGEKRDAYFNRYPGFISERLITLFFEMNYKKYNIVYADKDFRN